MRKPIPVLLAALVLFAGCHKQDSYTYSGIEAGSIESGVFTSDNGTKMTIAGNEGEYDVHTARRVLVSYETEPVTDPAHIRINLRGLLDAGILQPLLHIDNQPGVDIPGAGSALYGTPHTAAEGSDTADPGQRKHAVIFQQHHALRGQTSGPVHVSLFALAHFRVCCCKYLRHTCLPFTGLPCAEPVPRH